jgi:cyclomaltodextrinase / maltogenic alpha-amylase / neopullulanase
LLLEPNYLAWYGVLDMPKLNQRNPETRAYFLDVTAYWLREFDVDGWRMDVARHVESDFWTDFRRVAKSVKPDCYLLAEIWGNTSPWLQGQHFDATMNYFCRDLCAAYFARADMGTAEFVDGVTRMLSLYAPDVMHVTHNLISSHDVERFLFAAGEDVRRLRLAHLFILTIPGAPGLYYGDEVGMSGGNDPDCRGAFPWHAPESWDLPTLALMREVAGLRHEFPALRFGEWRAVWVGQEAFAYVRTYQGQAVLVVINRGDQSAVIEVPVAVANPRLLWGGADVRAAESSIIFEGLTQWTGAVVLLSN